MAKIIFIDNSEPHRFLIQEELGEAGHEVAAASDHEDALLRCGDLKVDAVILELRQKNIGWRTFEKLRRQHPGARFIGYSTFPECPDQFIQWVDFYVSKSANMDPLKDLMRA
jgi:CheY-like chemotaxis protein